MKCTFKQTKNESLPRAKLSEIKRKTKLSPHKRTKALSCREQDSKPSQQKQSTAYTEEIDLKGK